MYACERCGTRFGRPAAVLESCPRCLAREGVRVSLAFRALEDAGPARSGARLPSGLEAAVRRAQAGGNPGAAGGAFG
jgi:hypothetical protein